MSNESFDDLFPSPHGETAPRARSAEQPDDGASHRPAAHASAPSSRGSSRSNTGSTPRVARIRQGSGPLPPTSRSRARHAAQQDPPPVAPQETSPYQDCDRYLRISKKPKDPKRKAASIAISIVVLAAAAFGAFFFVQSLPATITLNGHSLEVGGGKTIGDALRASGIKPQPGDLVAVDGSVLEQGKGEPFHATVNGKATADAQTKLASGDVVEIGNGNPLEEPADAVQEAVPYSVTVEGTGAIHLVEGKGADGSKTVKTGRVSGLTVETVDQEPVNLLQRNVSPDVGDDKVIALTFDDGPWPDSTAQVLDVLAENGAKATFFTVGNRIDGEGVNLVKRAAAEGHQICTHSFDHASGSGQSVNLGYMTPDEQVAEIEKGYAAIEAATGSKASRAIRAPGGNFGVDVVKNIGPLISSEIGWNIDSRDWEKPSPHAIVSQLEGAWPGSIVLMHDGGGDRSQTVKALKVALPRLRDQGYRFITLDELLAYPLS